MTHAEQLKILDPEVYERALEYHKAHWIKSLRKTPEKLPEDVIDGWFIFGDTSEGLAFWRSWCKFLYDPAPLERRKSK